MPQNDLLRVGWARLSVAAVKSSSDYVIPMKDIKGELKLLERSMVGRPILTLELAQPLDEEKVTKRMRIWIALDDLEVVIVRDSNVDVITCAPFSITHGTQAWNEVKQRKAQHANWLTEGPQPKVALELETALFTSRRLACGLKNNQIKIINTLRNLHPKLQVASSERNVSRSPPLLASTCIVVPPPSPASRKSSTTPRRPAPKPTVPAATKLSPTQEQQQFVPVFPTLEDHDFEKLLPSTINNGKMLSPSIDFDFDFFLSGTKKPRTSSPRICNDFIDEPLI